MSDPRERILDMLEAIDRIERHTARRRSTFEGDELLQTWVVHHLQIIGGAAAKLGSEFHDAHPQIPWPQVMAMRNVLVHDYFGIDPAEVWQTVERDLPALKGKLRELAAELSSSE